MEVKNDITTVNITVLEEELIDLPVADEQADEMNGGAGGKVKLFLCPSDNVLAN